MGLSQAATSLSRQAVELQFPHHYLNPVLLAGCVEMTQPDSPRSPTQGYRLTASGQRLLRALSV